MLQHTDKPAASASSISFQIAFACSSFVILVISHCFGKVGEINAGSGFVDLVFCCLSALESCYYPFVATPLLPL
jgi:hypothetical protein